MEKHEQCQRCGRKLKTEKSQELGFGSVCFAKDQAEKSVQKRVKAELDEPELEDAPAPNWGHFEDECRWDSDRIEATKSILFQEFIGRR